MDDVTRHGKHIESSAEISANAEISAPKVARDPELFHFGLERCPFHAKTGCAREIQGVQPQSVAGGIVERQDRVFVLDHLAL